MSPPQKRYAFQGMMAPTFAPLSPDGSINVERIRRYAQLLHDGGVTGVFINGTLGEGPNLTVEERESLAEAWCVCADMVGHVVVHVGGGSISDAKRLARHAEAHGVAAIACLPPLYDAPSGLQPLIAYCAEVAAAAPNTPFLYYHIPSRTGVTLPLDELLAQGASVIPTLAGAKFTSMDVSTEGVRCLAAAEGCMTVLTGFDQTMTASRRLGFPGIINGCLNFMPLEAGRLFCLAGLADDFSSDCCVPRGERQQEVERLQQRVDTPWTIMAKHGDGSMISAAKLTMRLLTGIDVGPARLPQMKLSEAAVAAISKELTGAGYSVTADSN